MEAVILVALLIALVALGLFAAWMLARAFETRHRR